MAYSIGFHAGPGGNRTGIAEHYFQPLDAAGIPFSFKTSDDLGTIVSLANEYQGADHVLVCRITKPAGLPDDAPKRDKYPHNPAAAAHELWNAIKISIGDQLDGVKDRVWLEPTNEGDTHSLVPDGWFANFLIELGDKMLQDGYKALLPGFNAGQPEPEHWTDPNGLLPFLQFVSANRDRVAISVHEAKLWDMHGTMEAHYPWLVGRFTFINNACDALGLPYPDIIASEWAWSFNDMPGVTEAMGDINWLYNNLLIPYPNLIAVMLWNLGGGAEWANLPNKLQQMIKPVADYLLQANRPPVEPEPEPEPEPPGLWYKSIPVLLPQTATLQQIIQVRTDTYQNRRTISQSHDEVIQLVKLGAEGSYVIIYNLDEWDAKIQTMLTAIPHELRVLPGTEPPPDPEPTITKITLPAIYNQRDSRWANDCLGVCNGHTKTIGNWGCLMVAYNTMARHMGLTTMLPNEYNRFMANQGAFSGQFIKPGALKIAHPEVPYEGFLQRGETLNNKIRAWIDNDLPVPARVDFNPNTSSQWEQHWVLVTGYTSDGDFIIADPWHGDEVRLSERYNISGNDVLEGLFYREPEPVGLTVDLARFMIAQPHIWRVVRHPAGNQEDFRDIILNSSGRWAMVKNQTPPYEYAEFWSHDSQYIYLTKDTSPADASDGTKTMYIVNPGRWAKRRMRVGETFNDGGHVVQFYNKLTCEPHPERSGNASNTTTLLDYRTNFTFNRYGQGITLDEVIFLKGNTEIQIFARHNGVAYGRVGWDAPWGQSEVVEIRTDRGILTVPPREFCNA